MAEETQSGTDDDQPLLRVVGGASTSAATSAHWESVYRETVVQVYRYIYARAGNRADAEDLTTQVYIRALPRLRLPASMPEIRSYLFATARTVLADHWRNHYDALLVVLGDETPAPAARPSPPEREEDDPGVRRANEVLARLPDNYRQVLELRFLRGYSIRETATALNLTVANTKVLQFRALRRAAQRDQEAQA
ncbi:MAG: sigma-70 family RNA polymerase sigma factor [Candidatus Dormiibacterota bacterium]